MGVEEILRLAENRETVPPLGRLVELKMPHDPRELGGEQYLRRVSEQTSRLSPRARQFHRFGGEAWDVIEPGLGNVDLQEAAQIALCPGPARVAADARSGIVPHADAVARDWDLPVEVDGRAVMIAHREHAQAASVFQRGRKPASPARLWKPFQIN